MEEASRFRFFCSAIWADIRSSRGWQIVTTLYLLSGIVMFVLRFFTTWTPALLLSSWSAKSKWILFLAYLCAGLIILLIVVVVCAGGVRPVRIGLLFGAFERH